MKNRNMKMEELEKIKQKNKQKQTKKTTKLEGLDAKDVVNANDL